MGKFELISKNEHTTLGVGHITPHTWDAIDGTLYVDENGKPWMVFVYEWTSTPDGIGRMAYAPLSDDLTSFLEEPKIMFKANDAPWSNRQVTDGCYLYRCEDGTLLMIWSNGSKEGYCVGIARSKSGNVEGPWEQDEERLFYRKNPGEMDGGHAMIFTDPAGQMYLALHGPNRPGEGEKIKVVFFPLKEENDTLVIV
jgi:beta-xylosidase